MGQQTESQGAAPKGAGGGVDVLAVMRRDATDAIAYRGPIHAPAVMGRMCRESDEARAAVAELIAVAKEAELVLAEKLRRLGADPNVSPTIHKLRAALSNIEGASHG